MTGYLTQALQDFVSDEPPIGITVADVVNRGKQHRRKRRRWLMAALMTALLPLPPVGLGVASAMSGGTADHPRPAPSPEASNGSGSDSPEINNSGTGTGSVRNTPPSTRSPSSRPAEVNQIVDPSFEAVPTGWSKFKPETTVLTSTDTARTGARALTITTTSTVNAVGGVSSSPVQVIARAGTTYRASCWVRAPVKVDAIVQVQEYFLQPDKSLRRAGDAAKSPQVMVTDPEQWYQVSVTYTATQNGTLLPLVVFSSWLRAGYSSLTVDDCSLVVVS